MCKAFEELAEKRVIEEKKALAKIMLEDGKISVEEISKYFGLSVNAIEEIKNAVVDSE